jgi:hypothetical protein
MMTNPGVKELILPVLFITIGATWLADILKILCFQHNWFTLQDGITAIVSLLFLVLGLSLAKNVSDKRCKPNQLSFEELSKSKKDKVLFQTNLVICGMSTIVQKSKTKNIIENIEVEELQKHIKDLFSNNDVHKLCNEFSELKTDLKSFSWQQQIRLFKEMSRFHKSFTVSVIASEESYEQLPAFQTLINEFNAKFNTYIQLKLPEKAVDYTQVNEVHQAIEKIIQHWQIDNRDSYRMIDVTAGQKPLSMSAVLASVANKQNYTAYVDTQKPFSIRIQNIENQKQSELKVI